MTRPPARQRAEPADDARGRRLDPDGLPDHLDRLYRAAWALCGSREDAEDLVQETYTRVLAKPRFLRRDGDLGYLLRVLRNTYVSSRRTADRRPRTAALDDAVYEPADASARWQPDAALEARELFAVIATLDEPFRDALVAIDVAGLSYDEAAHALKVKPATITTRLHRARRRVAAMLAGEQPGAATPGAATPRAKDERDRARAPDAANGEATPPPARQAGTNGLGSAS